MLTTTGVMAAAAVLALAVNTLPNGETQPMVFEASGAAHAVASDGSGDFTTISEAIAAAGNGDEITIAPGTYAETLMIDKNVAITGLGAPGEVILGGSEVEEDYVFSDAFECLETCALLIDSASPRISNVMFTGGVRIDGGAPSISGVSFDGVGLSIGDTSLDLRDSSFTVQGLEIRSGDGTMVEGNSFSEGADVVIWAWAEGATRVANNEMDEGMIVAAANSDMTIEGNTFRGSGNYWEQGGAAIMVEVWAGVASEIRPHIIGNRFEGGKTGIIIEAETQPLIEDNDFVDLAMAVQVGRSPAHITGNSISDSESGIVAVSGGNPTITDNVIDVSGRGIVAGSGTSPVIDGNTVCGADASIYVADTATPELGDNQTCEDGVTG